MLGSFSLFFFFFCLFAKFLPAVSMTEMKEAAAPPTRERSQAQPAAGSGRVE